MTQLEFWNKQNSMLPAAAPAAEAASWSSQHHGGLGTEAATGQGRRCSRLLSKSLCSHSASPLSDRYTVEQDGVESRGSQRRNSPSQQPLLLGQEWCQAWQHHHHHSVPRTPPLDQWQAGCGFPWRVPSQPSVQIRTEAAFCLSEGKSQNIPRSAQKNVGSTSTNGVWERLLSSSPWGRGVGEAGVRTVSRLGEGDGGDTVLGLSSHCGQSTAARTCSTVLRPGLGKQLGTGHSGPLSPQKCIQTP